MLLRILDFLFSAANNFSVGFMAALVLIWVAALVCYLGQKLIVWRRTVVSHRAASESGKLVDIESFRSDLTVAKAQARG